MELVWRNLKDEILNLQWIPRMQRPIRCISQVWLSRNPLPSRHQHSNRVFMLPTRDVSHPISHQKKPEGFGLLKGCRGLNVSLDLSLEWWFRNMQLETKRGPRCWPLNPFMRFGSCSSAWPFPQWTLVCPTNQQHVVHFRNSTCEMGNLSKLHTPKNGGWNTVKYKKNEKARPRSQL